MKTVVGPPFKKKLKEKNAKQKNKLAPIEQHFGDQSSQLESWEYFAYMYHCVMSIML